MEGNGSSQMLLITLMKVSHWSVTAGVTKCTSSSLDLHKMNTEGFQTPAMTIF